VESPETDIPALLAIETAALVATLEALGPDEDRWHTPSLCDGWTVRDVVVHLLMPYELSVPRFLVGLLRARFSFDALADRWARTDPRSPVQALAALADTPRRRFAVPGAPPEAPLSHLVIHAQDVVRPLGIALRPGPEAARVVLDQTRSPRFRQALPAGLPEGVAYRATDADWAFGEGAEVTAPAAALITTFAGRAAALDELGGPGAPLVRAGLAPSPH
jgi:uncharacterized protein (TIGR03083 family)